MDYLIFLILGCFAGFVAGLLGVGGGLIIVPVLTWIFQSNNFEQSHIMHIALGTSLATIIFTSLASIRAHHKKGAIKWKLVFELSPGLLVGALIGAYIAHGFSTTMLKTIFGIFEILVAIQIGFEIQANPHRQLPNSKVNNIVSSVIGAISSLVGIGGGTLTVPFLVWCNIRIQNAIAVSAACGFPIAVAGALGYIISGINQTSLPSTFGYVYLPAWIMIIAASTIFAPLGAHYAHKLPAKTLRKIFSLLLLTLAIKMLFF